VLVLLGAMLWLALAGAPARAGEKEDNAIIAVVDKIISQDIANANFGDARKKLKGLAAKCKKGCGSRAVSQIHLALGIISAQLGQADDAKSEWFDALNADPSTTLPATGIAPPVRQKFEQIQKAWVAANPQMDDAQKAGWVNKEAFELAKAAIAAASAENWTECIEKDKAALAQEEQLRARVHLAECESRDGKIIDALRDNQKALEAARKANDTATVKLVQERVLALLPRLARVKFEAPKDAVDLKVSFDDRAIPTARLSEAFTIDPGPHTVHAEGVLRGARVAYDDKVDVKEGEVHVVKIVLKPAALTEGQLQCMVSAKTQEEIAACLPSERKPLVVHLGLDVSAYTDTTAVNVLTPGVQGSVTSPTAGWNVGGSYLLDVLSAASPDLVASASRRFHDERHAASLFGGYKPGRFGGQVFGNYSQERDYISRSLGLSLSGDFMDKQVTPSIGFTHTQDTIGRTGVDYDVYSKPFAINEFAAGVTTILSPTSLLVTGVTVGLESGDQSKPYRYVPFFEPGVSVPNGASPDEVNAARLPAKALEQLPTSRQRYSLAARYIARIKGNRTLRIEERLYYDSWQIMGSTTDARYLIDLTARLRVWPHVHLHAQKGAKFYQRVYGATLNSDGSAFIPRFRSTDRELATMFGVTGGGGVRYAVTDPSSSFQMAFFSTFDALYNQYLNALYITNRLALYGTVGVEVDFE
jgi:tetratricopeptide (TPR) repeat protein